jgi:UDP-N-acetylmuramate--alanine ligase
MDEAKILNEEKILSLDSKKFFFLGICGIGMSALAQYIKLHTKNIVTGSDIHTNNDVATILKETGISIIKESDISESIIDTIDILVITNIIFKKNNIIELAKKKNKIIIQRSKLLGIALENKKVIAISGSHGKTTTTGLTIKLFKDASRNPLGFIGGIMPEFKNNFISTKKTDPITIVEADEAFKSFLDLKPYYTVITTIGTEHLETYKNFEDIENHFISFVDKTHSHGAIIINIDSNEMKFFSKKIKHQKIISYGLDQESEIRIKNIILEKERTLFDLYKKEKKIETFSLSLPGLHNIKNATASIIVALENQIPIKEIKKSLLSHQGVKRRFEYIGATSEGIAVYDDYGHHPTEIDATLSILKDKGIAKAYIFFQFHRFSRTEQLWNDFIETFKRHKKHIGCIYMPYIYSAGEVQQNPTKTTPNFILELHNINIPAKYCNLSSTFEDFLLYKNDIKDTMSKDKIIILTLGAGLMNHFAAFITKKCQTILRLSDTQNN